MRKVTTRKMSTKELEREARNETMKEKQTEMTMEMGMATATATEMMKEKARKMREKERTAFSGTPRRCPYRQLDTETNISIMNTVFCRLICNI